MNRLLLALLALALLAPAAGAVPPGGPRPSHNGAKVKLHDKSAKPGGSIRVSGRKFPAGNDATVKLDDQTILAVFKINRKGRFSGRVPIPSNVFAIVSGKRHWLRFLAPASSVNKQSNTSIKRRIKLRRR